MVPFDRFTVVLDACTLFPMLTRDVLLTLANPLVQASIWLNTGDVAALV